MSCLIRNRSDEVRDTTVKRIRRKYKKLQATSLSSIRYKSQSRCSNRDSFVCDIPVERVLSNGECITLVWFEPNLAMTRTNVFFQNRLRALNDYVLFYTQKSSCLGFLDSQQARNDFTIVVLYDIQIMAMVHEYDHIHAILVVASNNTRNEEKFMCRRSKVVGIFDERDSVLVELPRVISHIERHSIRLRGDDVLSRLGRRERSMRDVRQELGSFLYCTVLKVMLKVLPQTLDARQQMLDECRSYYRGNSNGLAKIDEFEQTYRPADAINWYTRSTFVYRSVNKALRTGDLVALSVFRYFISDLCATLETVCLSQKLTTQVYRGSLIHRDEVEKYHVGHVLATNGFFSASQHLSVAEMFIGWNSNADTGHNRSRTDQEQLAIFEIDIDSTLSGGIVFANVSSYSAVPDEKEVLFSLGTIFEIVAINYECEHGLWRIQMRPSLESIYLYREYEQYTRDRMVETNATIFFGILLADMGEYQQSLTYFQRLLTRIPHDHHDRANCYYSVARAYRFTGRHRRALEYFARAERLQRARLPESSFDLARTLAGIGSTYSEIRNHDQKLLYYEQALQIYQKILPDDHIEIASSLNRLGFAYTNQQQYTQALNYLTRSLTIFDNTVPKDHPGKARTLHHIGLVYHALGNVEQTLEYCQKALKMRETVLPADHPCLAESCYHLSVVYQDQREQRIVALDYALRALTIREKKLPHDHDLVRQAKDMVDRLQYEAEE